MPAQYGFFVIYLKAIIRSDLKDEFLEFAAPDEAPIASFSGKQSLVRCRCRSVAAASPFSQSSLSTPRPEGLSWRVTVVLHRQGTTEGHPCHQIFRYRSVTATPYTPGVSLERSGAGGPPGVIL